MTTSSVSRSTHIRTQLLLASALTMLVRADATPVRTDAPYDPGLAPCQQAAPPPQLSPNEVPGATIPAGRIDAAVAQIDWLARDLMASSRIPGMAVAVVVDGKQVFAKGYGVRSLATGEAVDPDTVFQLASVSKSVGATVVARELSPGTQLSGIGVQWDTPVQDLMPSFQLLDPYVGNNATIGDLYAHRSGLPEHAGDLLEDLGYDRAAMIEKLRLVQLAPFRSSYAYTNFGLTAAAEAVAVASGTDWATLSQQAIYAPLGMNSTSSRYADFVARSNRAVGHVAIKVPVKSGDEISGYEIVGYKVSPVPRDPDTQSPAGGVSSSVNDMTRWMSMVLGRGRVDGTAVVDGCTLLAAVSPQIVSGPPVTPSARAGFYGYGFNVGDSAAGRVVLTHSGAFALGAATAYTLIPSANVGIMTLTNADPVGVPETLNAEFADLVQFGAIQQDWKTLYANAFAGMVRPTGALVGKNPPAKTKRPRPLAAYAGVYQNDYYGPAKIAVRRGGLILMLGPGQMKFPLAHWDGDVFTFTPPGESAPAGSISQATFANGALTIEYLDDHTEYPGVFIQRRPPTVPMGT